MQSERHRGVWGTQVLIPDSLSKAVGDKLYSLTLGPLLYCAGWRGHAEQVAGVDSILLHHDLCWGTNGLWWKRRNLWNQLEKPQLCLSSYSPSSTNIWVMMISQFCLFPNPRAHSKKSVSDLAEPATGSSLRDILHSELSGYEAWRYFALIRPKQSWHAALNGGKWNLQGLTSHIFGNSPSIPADSDFITFSILDLTGIEDEPGDSFGVRVNPVNANFIWYNFPQPDHNRVASQRPMMGPEHWAWSPVVSIPPPRTERAGHQTSSYAPCCTSQIRTFSDKARGKGLMVSSSRALAAT